jgi:hypothetical protein
VSEAEGASGGSSRSAHIFDELPNLLLGRADRATVAASVAHLRDCEDCCDDLINALAAHAALRSALGLAPELLSVLPADRTDSADQADRTHAARPRQLRELVAVDTSAAGHRLIATRWLAGAAVVAVGTAAVALAMMAHSSVRPVSLVAYGQGTFSATASVVGDDEIRIFAVALPPLGGGDHYEVWLTDPERTVTIPVGALNGAGTGDFPVSSSIMRTYSAIEVSIQTPIEAAYSGVSVLRGNYR